MFAAVVAGASFFYTSRLMENRKIAAPKPIAAMVQKDTAKHIPIHVRVPFGKTTLEKARSYLLSNGFEKGEVDTLLCDKRLEKLQLFPKKTGEKRKPLTYGEYKKIFGPELLAKLGAKFYAAHKRFVDSVASRSSAPKEMALSILGIETIYGKETGKHRVVNVFLTYLEEGKRRDFALGELAAMLRICKKYGADPLSVRGSHAGAITPSQFIPTSIERFDAAAGCSTFDELCSIETSIKLVFAYLSASGASGGAGYGIGGANYTAAFAYNHSSFYARLSVELAEMIQKKISAETTVAQSN